MCHLPHGAALSNLPYYKKKTVNEQQTKAEETTTTTTKYKYTRPYEFTFVNPYNCAAQHFYFPVAPPPTAERQKGSRGTGLNMTREKKLLPIERVLIFG